MVRELEVSLAWRRSVWGDCARQISMDSITVQVTLSLLLCKFFALASFASRHSAVELSEWTWGNFEGIYCYSIG